MEKFGIIKEFDTLGRLVIPKELRERYGLQAGVEIVATREGVLLKSPEYVLTKKRSTNQKAEANAPLCTCIGALF